MKNRSREWKYSYRCVPRKTVKHTRSYMVQGLGGTLWINMDEKKCVARNWSKTKNFVRKKSNFVCCHSPGEAIWQYEEGFWKKWGERDVFKEMCDVSDFSNLPSAVFYIRSEIWNGVVEHSSLYKSGAF